MVRLRLRIPGARPDSGRHELTIPLNRPVKAPTTALRKATFATGRIQSLGHNVLLVVKGSGQITTGPVVVIEQMLLGGPDSVRGYQLGERFVDEGYTLSAETRIPLFPSLMPTALKETQGAIFIDYGAGRLRNPSPGEQRSTSLTGTGVGLQTQLPWYSSSVRLDLGFPIGPTPNRRHDCRRPFADVLFPGRDAVLNGPLH